MSEISKNTPAESDELTFKELVLKVQEFAKEILQNWKIVLLLAIPFSAFFLYQAYKTAPTYPAQVTFMINEESSGGGGGAMAILNQFGFGSGIQGTINLIKMIELAKSKKIIHAVLFEKIEVNDQSDFIANHIIDIYDFHYKWRKSSALKDFRFSHDSLANFTRIENIALQSVYSRIKGSKKEKPLIATGVDEETGIVNLDFISESEALSYETVNTLFDHLSVFYINQTIEKQKTTYDIIKAKTDSIKTVLDRSEYSLAKIKDSSRGAYTYTSEIKQQQLEREIHILNIMYGESIRNLELADFSLKSKTPFIQLIDAPLLPISPKRESKLKSLILGGFIGCFIAFAFLIGRKIFYEAMAE